MASKKGVEEFPYSEPEFLISTMDRHDDWAVIVCLVGGGQEINTGEAGLPEWFDSLRKSFPDWDVYITPQLNDEEYRRDYKWNDMICGLNIIERPELHLSTSVRSFRTPDLAAFVKALLDVDIENGNKDITTYEDLENFVTDLDRDVSSYKITVEAVTEDGNVTEIKGYVAEIDGVYVYDASYSNDTITLAIADTNYKFKVDGGCTIKEEGTSRSRDLENIEDALVDDDVYATSIEIDEEGYVTSIKYELE